MAFQSEFSALASSSLPSLGVDSTGWQMASVGGQPSSGSVDMNHLHRLSESLQPAASRSFSNTGTMSHTYLDIDEMIRKRRDDIMNEVYQKELGATAKRSQENRMARLKKDWGEQREKYLKETIGGRRLGGSSKIPKSTNTTNYVPSQPDLQTVASAHVQLVTQWSRQPSSITIVDELLRMASKFPKYATALKLAQCLRDGDSTTIWGRALATLNHLAQQFQSFAINKVQTAGLAGQSFGELKFRGMAKTIAIFVKLQYGSTSSLWAVVFFCLRCGDAVAALHVLETMVDEGHPVRNRVALLAEQQGSSTCFWGASPSMGASLHHHYPASDPYETACWTLLCGTAPLSGEGVLATVEDYLYATIWFSIRTDNPEDEMKRLGTSIENLGPEHFEGDGTSSGWSFAQPLLLVQKYSTALRHLAKSGNEGLLHSIHVALIMPNLDPGLLANLFIQFSKELQYVDAPGALAYLIQIPDPATQRKEIARLVVETRRFEELAGTLSVDGVRQGRKASLDQYFTPEQISRTLEDAAEVARSRKNIRDGLELLNLAERYDRLLTLLSEQIIGVIKANPGPERDFWIKASQHFDSWHFGGRRTHAAEVLERMSKLDLVETFHTVLNLSKFFDRHRMHDFKEAWSILEGLYLLPSTDDQMDTRARGMDPIMSPILDDIMLGAMECLYQQFVHLKHSGVITDANTVQERLYELIKRGRLLVAFAGRLSLEAETTSRMTGMEAQMV